LGRIFFSETGAKRWVQLLLLSPTMTNLDSLRSPLMLFQLIDFLVFIRIRHAFNYDLVPQPASSMRDYIHEGTIVRPIAVKTFF